MLKRLQNFFMHAEWKLSLINALFGVGGLVSSFGLGAWASAASDWMRNWGPVGWVLVGLLCVLLWSIAYFAFSAAKLRLIRAAAYQKWLGRVDYIDPMAKNFDSKRIKILDLVDPVSNEIRGVTLTNCDLIGPANFVAIKNTSFVSDEFVECDIVPLRDRTDVNNAIPLYDCNIIRCRLLHVTVYADFPSVQALRRMPGMTFVAYAKDEIVSLQQNAGKKGVEGE